MIANQKIGSANSSAVVPMAFNEDIERGPMKTKTNQEKSLQRQYSNLSSNTELWTASSTTAQVFGTTKLQPKVGNDFFVSKPVLSSASSSNTSPHLSRNKLSYADVESIHQGSQLHKDDPFVTHRDFDTIKSYLTSYYSLKDVELRATFQQFNETRRSVGLFYFFMTIVFTLIIFPASALEFFGDIDAYSEYHSVPKYNQRIASSVILFINNLGGILSSWYLLSFYMPYSLFRFFPRHCGKLYEYLVKWNNQKCIRCAKTVLVCCIQVFFLGMLCQRSLNLNCVTPINSYSKFFNGQLCYEGLALQNIILAQGFVALTIPLLISVNLPEVVIEVVWANFILAFFVSILVCVASSQYDNILYLLIWSAVGFFSIIDTQIRNVTMFFVNMDLNLALSEVRRIEEENRANEMRHMIANVAHDLKTPLSSLSSGIEFINLFLSELHGNFTSTSLHSLFGKTENKEVLMQSLSQLIGQSLESISSCLVNMRDTNSFMLMTINRCIDYTKATKGIKLVPHLETIHLLESMQLPINCIQNLQDRITVQLAPIPSSMCAYVITDKQWLRENMLCLLSNAVKYSTGGEVRIRLQVATVNELILRQNNGDVAEASRRVAQEESSLKTVYDANATDLANTFVLIEVEDSGIGLSKDYQQQLFRPFRQAQRLTGGTGLGLFSLAKRIEALSGYYGVHNRKDGQRGCVFWFAVPYRPDELTATVKADSIDSTSLKTQAEYVNVKAASTPASTRRTRSKCKVLVVDDSPAIVKMTTMLLNKKGFETDTAENGQVAVDKITKLWTENNEQYDVILMDLQMPVMDGLEATRRIRLLEKDMVLPQLVVGMSANSDHETKQAAITTGMDTFIGKPFNMQQFQDILQSHGLFSMV